MKKQKKVMDNISIILPIHELNEQNEKYLNLALSSVTKMKNSDKAVLIVVGPKEVITNVETIANSLKMKQKITLVENDDTDFCTQVNKGVMQCVTKYFSVLEFDDTYNDFWFNYASTTLESDPNISVLLPIIELYNTENKFVTFVNEMAWSGSLEEKIGTIDSELLEVFMDFNVTGGIIRTEDFISIGGLKKSLKIAAWYEFLLRCAYNSKLIYVAPKSGYNHLVGRDNSYMNIVRETINQQEGEWLINTAKQEYFFKEDRNKTFAESTEVKE